MAQKHPSAWALRWESSFGTSRPRLRSHTSSLLHPEPVAHKKEKKMSGVSKVKNKVAIVGAGYTKAWRHALEPLGSLAVQACDAAIEDAGLTRDQIDGVIGCPSLPAYGT